MATPKGGFDCEFVAAPPKSLECPVCLLTLREPHLISCCGNHFCRPCIQRIQNDNKPCPLCNEPNFTTFLHKGVMREVNSLMVHCPQKELGCDWEGELGQLQQHQNPAVESRGKGCGFVLIDCVYKCGEQFPRREIQQHELEECLKRPVEVQISSLARKLESTRAENQFLKKDLGEKLNAVMVENQAIKAENKALQEMVKQLQSCVNPTPPFYLILRNVKHHMQEDLSWMSPPFYSHVGGYKMYIVVYANGFGSGKGTHLSLLIGIMGGEYDDQLQWPFQGKVITQTFMQREGWGNDATITFGDTVPHYHRRRPPGCVCNPPFGFIKLIKHDQLQVYCDQDKIHFRVNSVDL